MSLTDQLHRIGYKLRKIVSGPGVHYKFFLEKPNYPCILVHVHTIPKACKLSDLFDKTEDNNKGGLFYWDMEFEVW